MKAASFAGFLMVTGAAFGQGYQGQVTPGPEALIRNPEVAKLKVEQKLGFPVGEASLVDDAGRPTSMRALLDGKRPTILLPIFYRCTGVCNLELAGITAALANLPQWRVGRDVRIVALGLHPKETAPLAAAKKKEAIRTYGAAGSESGWTFTTGKLDDVSAITRSLGFAWNYDAARDRVNHPSGIMILTPDGTISSYILGTSYDAGKLDKLLTEAKKGAVGQKTEELFFGCVHVDPVTGERSVQIKNVLKVFGIATLGALTISILAMAGRLRRRKEGVR